MNIDYVRDGNIGIISIDHGRLTTLTPAMHRQQQAVPLEFLADPAIHCGEPVAANQARRLFPVNEVVEDDQVFDRATAIACRIAEHSPLSVSLEREACLATENLTPCEATRFGGRQYQLQRLANPDSGTESFEKARARKADT